MLTVLILGFGLMLCLALIIDLDDRLRVRARRRPDGWVLRRQVDTEHFCRPPDVENVSMPGWGRQIIYARCDEWATGDLWLCECGKAWTVVDGQTVLAKWVRSIRDDIPQFQGTTEGPTP